jgi:hypothetical protein
MVEIAQWQSLTHKALTTMRGYFSHEAETDTGILTFQSLSRSHSPLILKIFTAIYTSHHV